MKKCRTMFFLFIVGSEKTFCPLDTHWVGTGRVELI